MRNIERSVKPEGQDGWDEWELSILIPLWFGARTPWLDQPVVLLLPLSIGLKRRERNHRKGTNR
ncbi:MAG: hypothetical protein O3B74_06875 [Proteobacteria bacterium]|nr:hypothetical protein [Pseudomonadota bacterium]